MIRYFLILFFSFIFTNSVYSKENSFYPDDLFHIDHMDSHNKEFALYFKGREKSILARGEESNYINDFPRDLYKDKFENKKNIKNINSPILVMHGEADQIVPFSMGKKIYEIANEPKYSYFTKYDNHMMEYDENLLKALKSFLDSLN